LRARVFPIAVDYAMSADGGQSFDEVVPAFVPASATVTTLLVAGSG
jgi:hypothetical protein